MEKKERFQFQTSLGMNGKTGVPGEKNISRKRCKPYDINLDENRKTTTKTITTTTKNKERERERERERRTHTLSHNRTCVYTY